MPADTTTDTPEIVVRALTGSSTPASSGPVVSVLTHPGYDLAEDYVEPAGGDWVSEFPIRVRTDGRGVVNWTHAIPVGLGAVEHKAIAGDTGELILATGLTDFFQSAADINGIDLTEYESPSSRTPIGRYTADECLRAAADAEALVRGGYATGVSIEFRPNGPKGSVEGEGAYWDREVKSPMLPRPGRHFKSWTGLAYAHARRPVNPGCHTVVNDIDVELVAKAIRVMETGKVGGHVLCDRVLKSFREDAPDLLALARAARRSTVAVEGTPPVDEVKSMEEDPEQEPTDYGHYIRDQFTHYGHGPRLKPETGYLLADGTAVHMGEDGVRGDDHRAAIPSHAAMERWGWSPDIIHEARQGSRSIAMMELMRRAGAARVHVGDDLIVHHVTPITAAQRRVIEAHTAANRKAAVIFEPGYGTDSVEMEPWGDVAAATRKSNNLLRKRLAEREGKAVPDNTAVEVKAKSDAWIKWKVRKLIGEGKPRKQAVAIAYSMAGRDEKEMKGYTGPLRASGRLNTNPNVEDEERGDDEPDFEIPGLDDEDDRDTKAVYDPAVGSAAHRATVAVRDFSRDFAADGHIARHANAAVDAAQNRYHPQALASLNKLLDRHQAILSTGLHGDAAAIDQHREAMVNVRRAIRLHELAGKDPQGQAVRYADRSYRRPTPGKSSGFTPLPEFADRADTAHEVSRQVAGDAHRATRYAAMAKQKAALGDFATAGGAHLGAVQEHRLELKKAGLSDYARSRHEAAIQDHLLAASKLHAHLTSQGWVSPKQRRLNVSPGYTPYKPKQFSPRETAALNASREQRLAAARPTPQPAIPTAPTPATNPKRGLVSRLLGRFIPKAFEDSGVSDPYEVARIASGLAMRSSLEAKATGEPISRGEFYGKVKSAWGGHPPSGASFTDGFFTGRAKLTDGQFAHAKKQGWLTRSGEGEAGYNLHSSFHNSTAPGNGSWLDDHVGKAYTDRLDFRNKSPREMKAFHEREADNPRLNADAADRHLRAAEMWERAMVPSPTRLGNGRPYMKARTDGFDVPAVALGPDEKPPASISALMNFAQLQMDGAEALAYDAQQSDDLMFRTYAKALAAQSQQTAATLQKQASAMQQYLNGAANNGGMQKHPLMGVLNTGQGQAGDQNQPGTTTSGDVPPGADGTTTDDADDVTANGAQKAFTDGEDATLDALFAEPVPVPAGPEVDADGWLVFKAFPEWKPRRYAMSELRDLPRANTGHNSKTAAANTAAVQTPPAPAVEAKADEWASPEVAAKLGELTAQLKKLKQLDEAVQHRQQRGGW